MTNTQKRHSASKAKPTLAPVKPVSLDPATVEAERRAQVRRDWAENLDIDSLTPNQRSLVAVAAYFVSNANGCITPFETFLTEILDMAMHAPVTPEHVSSQLAEFEGDWNMMANAARSFQNWYGRDIDAYPCRSLLNNEM